MIASRQNARLAMSLILLALQAGSSPVFAQEEPKQRAQELLKKGLDLYRAGKFEAALAELKAAHEIYPSPKLFYNMGVTYRALDRSADALEVFQRFVESDDPSPDQREQALRHIEELKPRVAIIEVQTDPGAALSLDGHPIGKAPLPRPVYLDPGTHVIAGDLPDHRPVELELLVSAGDVREVSMTFVRRRTDSIVDLREGSPQRRPSPSAAPAAEHLTTTPSKSPPAAAPAPGRPGGIAVAALASGAFLFAAGGVAFYFDSWRQYDRAVDRCGRGLDDSRACMKSADDVAFSNRVSMALFMGALTSAVSAGSVYLFFARRSDTDRPSLLVGMNRTF
jgi:tetratricopeptide (TPR) repeat protein